jgi:hypothetical protein
MGCGVHWQQLNELERALGTMRRFGILETSYAYKQLYQLRGKLLSQVGVKFPRTIFQLVKLVGFSPGEIRLWHDVESGWLAEARATPVAPPVYHYVKDDMAMAILNKQVTPELEEYLLTPDTYVGE